MAGGVVLSNNKNAFNTLVAKPRVKSEHCIGILKGRFPFLRGIRLRLGSKKDMRKIINYIRGTVVLHNFLRNDDEWVPVEPENYWEGEETDPEAYIPYAGNRPNYLRRDEVYNYLSELEETVIN